MVTFSVNGKVNKTDIDPSTPLLWFIHDIAGLTGTKFGCGMAQCGACTVHINGEAIRSCITPVAALEGKSITTIEGVSDLAGRFIQDAWLVEDVPQCGYCQSGQIMSATALIRNNPHPTDADIDKAMSGNICRCGTYQRIRKAIHHAAEMLAKQNKP